MFNAGVLTVSDRSFRGERPDGGGPLLESLLTERDFSVSRREIVPDEIAAIRTVLRRWSDEDRLSLILTTGGTGVAPRDVTPEATRPLLDKEIPGLGELMRSEGLRHTPFAALSRGVAGLRGRTLIINLPGSPAGAEQSLKTVWGLIPHILELVHSRPTPHSIHPELVEGRTPREAPSMRQERRAHDHRR